MIRRFAPARRGAALAALATLAAPSSAALPAAPQDLLDRVAEHVLDGDRPSLRDTLRAAIADPSSAAAELEAALALVEGLVGEAHLGEWRQWFDGVDAPAGAHALRARLAWMRGDTRELFPLTAWEFVGPFDNERGRGMRRATPAERDPVAGPYDGKGEAAGLDWRPAPAPGPAGVLPIGVLLHPAEQACVTARTWVRSPEARDVVLLLGVSEQVRVWHQGVPAYEALDTHAFGFDGHGVTLSLEAGWNELFLKVGGEDGLARFTARLVDPITGAPVALDGAGSAPAGVEPIAPADPGRRIRDPRPALPPGTRAALEAAEDPRGALARSLLDSVREAAPRKQRPGLADAEAAHRALPGSPAAALAHLMNVRVGGALAIEEDVNPWLGVLRDAIDVHGPRYHLMRDYAAHAAGSQERTDRALELVRRMIERDPGSVPGRALLVQVLMDHGQPRAAEVEARRLAADPAVAAFPAAAVDMALWLDVDEPRRAALLEAAAAAGSPIPRELRRDAEVRSSREAADAILEEDLARTLARNPYDVGARIGAGRAFLARGRTPRALALFDEAAALAPDRPDVNGWRARALLVAGDVEGAIAAVEHALRFDPSNADEARFLAHLRGAGELAAGAAVPGFHERFREPLEDILARVGDTGAGEEAPREVLSRLLVIDAGADGTARRYGRTVERVLTAAGVRELDRIPFRAYPGQEEVRVLSAAVRRADGTVLDARTGRTGGRGVFVLDLPPLEVGDVVDVQWRRDDLAPTIFGDYLGIDAPLREEPRLPLAESTVVLLEPPGLDLAEHVAGEVAGLERQVRELEDGGRETRWRVTGLAPRRREHLEPPPAELEPRIQASTYADWASFGTWWWNLISEEIATSDEMRAKVAELTEGIDDPAGKLRAIYDFVVTDIRYNAWEFGIHGYQPYSAPVIFSRRFGDCKDKAIVLKAMLGEVGIEAWPVVIRAEGRRFEEDIELAMVSHFNHCIAYVPEQEGIPEMFLDGTARFHPMEVLPDSDRGAKVVVVKDGAVDVRRIPFPEAAENRMVDTSVVDLTVEGDPRVEVIQAPTGRWDPLLRRAYGGDAKERADAVERTLTRRFGGLTSAPQATHPDYEELDMGFEVRMSATAEEVGRPSGGGTELPVSLTPDELLQRVAPETERATDLLVGMPWSAERRLVYRLPPDSKVYDLPGAVELETEDLAYRRTVSAVPVEGALEVIVEESMEQRTHRVPAERYGAFREAARAIDRAQDETVEVEVIR